MLQLKKPNLSVKGQPHLCLQFTRNVFGVPSKYNSAWEAWQNTDYKHTDALPDAAVPVWFRWTGTVGGIRKNWGHVAVAVPGRGILSDPLKGNAGQLWVSSVEELENRIGGDARYVGWSEDINDVRVAQKEDDMAIERGRAIRLLRATHRTVNEAEIKNLMAQDEDEWLDKVYASNLYKAQKAKLARPDKYVPYTGEKLYVEEK